ncbi:MAG: helix-turn-helix domain-containing protein [Candidatus Brocadiae bacterium]|nr:helix-turn-helix domain-containing protein [Candidatus Brocadiia bacterium]
MSFYSTGELSKILGMSRWSLIYLLETGKIKEPMRIGGKRVFAKNDLEAIQQLLKERNNHEFDIRRNETADATTN